MKVYFSSKISTEGATYATPVHTGECIECLKDTYCMVLLNERHQCHSIEMLRVENGLEWSPKPLLTGYTFRADGNPILPARAINFSKVADSSTANVRRASKLTDLMQSLLSYTRAFEKDYGVCFVIVRESDIVEDMTSCNFLAASSAATNMSYSTAGKKMLPLLGKLGK